MQDLNNSTVAALVSILFNCLAKTKC